MFGPGQFGGYGAGNPYDRIAPRDPYARFLQRPQPMPRQAPPMAQRSAAFQSPAGRPMQPGAFGAAPPARPPAMQTPPPRQAMPPGAGNFQQRPPPMQAAPMRPPPMRTPPQPMQRGGLMGASGGMALSDDTAKYEKRVIRDLFHEY